MAKTNFQKEMNVTAIKPTIVEPYFLDLRAFCQRYSLSRQTLYRLIAAGKGPRTARIGAKLVVSVEAAREWAKALEQPPVNGGQVLEQPPVNGGAGA